MNRKTYLFDTHALIFWHNTQAVSEAFLRFFDTEERRGTLCVSSVSFWEIALLVKKGKLALPDVHVWKNELLSNSAIRVIDPTASDMIDSTLLPDHHNDPFDRLLIAQCRRWNYTLVTRDQQMGAYEVEQFWL